MSAWLVSNEHINTLITYALDHDVPVHDPEGACRLLTLENIRSLRERYPGRDFLEEWIMEAKKYRFERVADVPCATQIVKACNCYDYQACETNNYNQTSAAYFVETIRAKALSLGGQAKGKLYDQMSWGID